MTGLIAQQQCVGGLHTPVADVAVVGMSYTSVQGAAISVGEQPIKGFVDPKVYFKNDFFYYIREEI